ncbi:MAG TPA: SIS domain-containing protein [Fodinibius sp.]|nr:SIS domain-containing protein [Fodinibius sp.]
MNALTIPDTFNSNGTSESYTSKEIALQPSSWKKVWEKIKNERDRLTSFLQPLKEKGDLNIVLTGAGSSAFVGEAVSSVWLDNFSCPVQAIPTTDLVTHFKKRIATDKPLLLISFARSGNSPESTAAVQRADAYCEEVYHLAITCNPDGKLAQMASRDNSYAFLLPEEAEDQSLAMTNSFTSMALAATLIPSLLSQSNDDIDPAVEKLSEYGKSIIHNFLKTLQTVAQKEFDRVIFLGSGPLLGIARESHLKVQELTNGKVVGKFDSFLGFRHGPKAIIDDDTLVVYLLSNNDQVNRYEKDLMDQIARHEYDLTTLAVSEGDCISSDIDYCINMGSKGLDESLWTILCTLPGQIIGFYKSLLLGYNPDNPSPDGTISRVVEGVTIYDDGQ